MQEVPRNKICVGMKLSSAAPALASVGVNEAMKFLESRMAELDAMLANPNGQLQPLLTGDVGVGEDPLAFPEAGCEAASWILGVASHVNRLRNITQNLSVRLRI